MEWLDIIQKAIVSGGILYLLVDRFARTKEQRGVDEAQMVKQVSEAFSKTLDTVMTYSQDVINKMRENDKRDEERYLRTELRCEQLEQKVTTVIEDNELLRSIVSKAVTCKHLKSGDNKDCPVIMENQKRHNARCKVSCQKSEPK